LFEGFNQHVLTAGFRDVKIKDVDKFLQTIKSKTGETAAVQFFDASLIAGLEHLRFAALDALNAFKSGVSISNSLAMEIILYASARRQIKEALGLIGIKPSTRRVAVLILAETSGQASSALTIVSKLVKGRRDDSVIDLTDAKAAGLKQLFKISDRELEAKTERKGEEAEALVDLVIEHMALLVVQR
jgi:tRNA threonylcarbamoyladenosine modification (KEOPS) complex Cgi121 subunit